MIKLNQHVVVMDLAEGQPFDEVRKFRSASEDDIVEGVIPEAYYLTTKNWEDMGSPIAITITVQAGDLLNLSDEGETNEQG